MAKAEDALGNFGEPLSLIGACDQLLPQYLRAVEQGRLVYPAGSRKLNDNEGDVRSIWEHSRLEAMRYVMMAPKREFELLVEPGRQSEIFECFLGRRPHEDTLIHFTNTPKEDLVVAIFAGFNWLDHCAFLAGVHPDKFLGTHRHFNKVVKLAQKWWAVEDAGLRCNKMLAEHERPPLMFYLIWSEYTRLAKEIALAAVWGSDYLRGIASMREEIQKRMAGQPDQFRAALAAIDELPERIARALDPNGLSTS